MANVLSKLKKLVKSVVVSVMDSIHDVVFCIQKKIREGVAAVAFLLALYRYIRQH